MTHLCFAVLFISDYNVFTSGMTIKLAFVLINTFKNYQEPYMEGVNPFIKSNKHRMIMFLDELGVSGLKKNTGNCIATL